jgi:hypothetical protein
MIKFRIAGKGYIWAKNGKEVADKLGGRVIQSCPGFANIQLPEDYVVSITWKV